MRKAKRMLSTLQGKREETATTKAAEGSKILKKQMTNKKSTPHKTRELIQIKTSLHPELRPMSTSQNHQT